MDVKFLNKGEGGLMLRFKLAAIVSCCIICWSWFGVLSRRGLTPDKVDYEQFCAKVLDDDDSAMLEKLLRKGYGKDKILCSVECDMRYCHKCKTLLMLACQHRAVNCIGLLDKHGADYGFSMADGRTVLHYASHLEPRLAIEVAQKALSTGRVNLDDKDQQGCTPLIYALYRGNRVFADWLIDRGSTFDRWAEIAPGVRKSYLAMAMTAPYSAFEYLIDEEYSAGSDEVDPSELLLCVNLGAKDLAKRISKLLSIGASLNDIYIGRRLVNNLLRHCPQLTADKIQLLVDSGLPVSCLEQCLNRAESAQKEAIRNFLQAAKYKYGEGGANAKCNGVATMLLAQRIFRRDDVEHLNYALNRGLRDDGCYCPTSSFENVSQMQLNRQCPTLFALACQYNATNCIKRLMLSGVQYGDVLPDNRNLLHFLANTELSIAMEIGARVLMLSEADVDKVDIYGATPLWYALKAGNVGFAKWLVDRGAKLFRWKIIGPCKRELYLAEAMRFPYASFEYMIDEFDESSQGVISLQDLYLCIDMRSDDCSRRIAKLRNKGAMINVDIGDKIMWNLSQDTIVLGNEIVMNNITSEMLAMLVENGLPIECVVRASQCTSNRHRNVLVEFLAQENYRSVCPEAAP